MYENLTDEQLAEAVSKAIGLKFESALRAIRSGDEDLGRNWATGILLREHRHEASTERLSHHLQALRS